MKKKKLSFFLILLCGIFLSSTASAQKIYLLAAGDLNIPDGIRACVESGIGYVQSAFQLNVPDDYLVSYNQSTFDENENELPPVWQGPDLTNLKNVQEQVLEAIRNCPAGPDDTIVFYWVGHGAHDENGHFLDLTPNAGPSRFYRSEIRQALERKNVRFAALITESCNVKKPKEEGAGEPTSEPLMKFPQLIWSLFFETYGILDINSASPDEVAVALEDGGGIFTKTFCMLLSEKINRPVTWEEVIRKLDQEVGFLLESDSQHIRIWSLPTRRERSLPMIPIPGSEFDDDDDEYDDDDDDSSDYDDDDSGFIPSGTWSRPIYHAEEDDRIVEINGIRVRDEAHFRQIIRNADDVIIMKLVGHRTGMIFYFKTRLLPSGNRSRLGIYVESDYRGGVVITGTMGSMPGWRCQLLE